MKERQEESRPRVELRASRGAMDGVRGLYLQTPSLEKSPEARGLSQTMRDPAQRKRNASRKTNDRCDVPAKTGANGRGGESCSLTVSPNEAKTNGKWNGPGSPAPAAGDPGRESAASDDATGTTPAGDAAPSSAAACTGRDACAEVAAPRSRSSAARGDKSGTVDDRRPRASDDLAFSESKKRKKTPGRNRARTEEIKEYAPGIDEPLAFDAPGFVDEMHARVNLYEIGKEFLQTSDLKLKQRTWEYLLEMKYGRGAPATTEEMPRVDVELPRPQQ